MWCRDNACCSQCSCSSCHCLLLSGQATIVLPCSGRIGVQILSISSWIAAADVCANCVKNGHTKEARAATWASPYQQYPHGATVLFLCRKDGNPGECKLQSRPSHPGSCWLQQSSSSSKLPQLVLPSGLATASCLMRAGSVM